MNLTNEQWAGLTNAFDKWPFKPANLLEDGMLNDVKKQK